MVSSKSGSCIRVNTEKKKIMPPGTVGHQDKRMNVPRIYSLEQHVLTKLSSIFHVRPLVKAWQFEYLKKKD